MSRLRIAKLFTTDGQKMVKLTAKSTAGENPDSDKRPSNGMSTSLPLKKARSSIRADHGSGSIRPLLHPPPLCVTPNWQSRCPPPSVVAMMTPMNASPPPPRRCTPVLRRCGQTSRSQFDSRQRNPWNCLSASFLHRLCLSLKSVGGINWECQVLKCLCWHLEILLLFSPGIDEDLRPPCEMWPDKTFPWLWKYAREWEISGFVPCVLQRFGEDASHFEPSTSTQCTKLITGNSQTMNRTAGNSQTTSKQKVGLTMSALLWTLHPNQPSVNQLLLMEWSRRC